MNCTNIEQSKKLLDLGLSPESADMFYYKENAFNGALSAFNSALMVKGLNCDFPIDTIPAWSLGALLEVMPPYLFEWERGIDLNIYRNLNGKGWHVSYMPNNIESMQKDKFRQITNGNTPLEAAFNMVVWLLENGYIKTEKK